MSVLIVKDSNIIGYLTHLGFKKRKSMIPNRLSLRGYHNFNANATTRKGSDVFSVIKMYKKHKL